MDIKLLLGDAKVLIKNIPDNSIDLVFIDPPYDQNLYMDRLTDMEKKFFVKQFKRVLKRTGNLAICCGFWGKFTWYNLATEEGFKLKREIIWVYKNLGNKLTQRRTFLAAHETILWFIKSKDYYFNEEGLVERDWIETPRLSGILRIKGLEKLPTEKLNITPKPLKLARIIIKRLCPENGTVLDCFAGTGTFAIPCIEQRKNFIGFEINEKIFKIAEERISKFYPKTKISDFYKR